MTDMTRPRILLVDDSADSITPLRDRFSEAAVVQVRHPEEVDERDLYNADLVVVDYFLSAWTERDSAPLARAPRDGLAVVSTLRSILLPTFSNRPALESDLPKVAFALWSANLNEATLGLPEALREHVFARENNLEWAFSKEAIEEGSGSSQMVELASAVQSLPHAWPGRAQGDAAVEEVLALLGLEGKDTIWMDQARAETLQCRPPVFEMSQRNHGLALLRWLLHRVLPYPTFLIDEQYLRTRLRLSEDEIPVESPLWVELSECEYQGVLATFSGRRWWRSGVENWLWRQTDGRSGDPTEIARVITDLGCVPGSLRHPVVVIATDHRRRKEPAELEDVVRVRPDDWPPYADTAYADRRLAAEDPALGAMVEDDDRGLMDAV
ncbi:hypothetical protein GCM10009610_00590 [Pseudonocardia xinjiangensis]